MGEEMPRFRLAAVDRKAGDLGQIARPVAPAPRSGEKAEGLETHEGIGPFRSAHHTPCALCSGHRAIRFLRACKAPGSPPCRASAGGGP